MYYSRDVTTRQTHDVAGTSPRRVDVAGTSRRRRVFAGETLWCKGLEPILEASAAGTKERILADTSLVPDVRALKTRKSISSTSSMPPEMLT